jgi:nucleoside-specific outer membrane channel protein Tsx
VLLLAAALIVATMAVITAGPASADDNQSDSHLRHQINVIQNRPGPVTNQERNHIQNLRERIHDNNEDNNDD